VDPTAGKPDDDHCIRRVHRSTWYHLGTGAAAFLMGRGLGKCSAMVCWGPRSLGVNGDEITIATSIWPLEDSL